MNDIVDNLLDRLLTSRELLERERQFRMNAEAAVARLSASGPTPSVNDVLAMMDAMAAGKKIEAIKRHRTLTGYGLKESKDAIEAVMDRTRT